MADSKQKAEIDQLTSKQTEDAGGSSSPALQQRENSRVNPRALDAFQIANLLIGIPSVVAVFYLPGIFPRVAVVVIAALLLSLLYSPFINKCIKPLYVLIPSILLVGSLVYLLPAVERRAC